MLLKVSKAVWVGCGSLRNIEKYGFICINRVLLSSSCSSHWRTKNVGRLGETKQSQKRNKLAFCKYSGYTPIWVEVPESCQAAVGGLSAWVVLEIIVNILSLLCKYGLFFFKSQESIAIVLTKGTNKSTVIFTSFSLWLWFCFCFSVSEGQQQPQIG